MSVSERNVLMPIEKNRSQPTSSSQDQLLSFLESYRVVSKKSAFFYVNNLLHCLSKSWNIADSYVFQCYASQEQKPQRGAAKALGLVAAQTRRSPNDLALNGGSLPARVKVIPFGLLDLAICSQEKILIRRHLLQRFSNDPFVQAIAQKSCFTLPLFNEHQDFIGLLVLFGIELIQQNDVALLLLENIANRLGRELQSYLSQPQDNAGGSDEHQTDSVLASDRLSAERLAALAQDAAIDAANQAAAGMVHEIRNPLSFVLTATQLAKSRLERWLANLDTAECEGQEQSSPGASAKEMTAIYGALHDLDIVEGQALRLEALVSVFTKQVTFLDLTPRFVRVDELITSAAKELCALQQKEGQSGFCWTLDGPMRTHLLYLHAEALEKVIKQILLTMFERYKNRRLAFPRPQNLYPNGYAQAEFYINVELLNQNIDISFGEQHQSKDGVQLKSLERWRPLNQGVAMAWSFQIIRDMYKGDILIDENSKMANLFVVRLPYSQISGCRALC